MITSIMGVNNDRAHCDVKNHNKEKNGGEETVLPHRGIPTHVEATMEREIHYLASPLVTISGETHLTEAEIIGKV